MPNKALHWNFTPLRFVKSSELYVMCINLNINYLGDIGAERALPMQFLHERSY
jgi:uncharacterized protein YunC (DUF1805 family)